MGGADALPPVHLPSLVTLSSSGLHFAQPRCGERAPLL
jgi:hypothetical protein